VLTAHTSSASNANTILIASLAMTPQEAQKQAATAMSDILSEHEIAHAFIGGFAVNLLGHFRETADVDVEVDVAAATELQGRISPLLMERDGRFSLEHSKLFFTPSNHPELRVPVETLPIGELGLPPRLEIFRPGDSEYLSRHLQILGAPI
jgi:hypothetical protein